MKKNLCGLVMCGGKSTRMGMDKSRIIYHDKEQRYHIYNLLTFICDDVFISCKREQVIEENKQFLFLKDAEQYANIGPLSGLLTAFVNMPDCNFLVVGCDYPLITKNDIENFLQAIPVDGIAAAFYNPATTFYEPFLAYYSADCSRLLMQMHEHGENSLQQFLKLHKAYKFMNYDPSVIRSVDTPEQMQYVQEILKNQDEKYN